MRTTMHRWIDSPPIGMPGSTPLDDGSLLIHWGSATPKSSDIWFIANRNTASAAVTLADDSDTTTGQMRAKFRALQLGVRHA
jgi:hypothetical protein